MLGGPFVREEVLHIGIGWRRGRGMMFASAARRVIGSDCVVAISGGRKSTVRIGLARQSTSGRTAGELLGWFALRGRQLVRRRLSRTFCGAIQVTKGIGVGPPSGGLACIASCARLSDCDCSWGRVIVFRAVRCTGFRAIRAVFIEGSEGVGRIWLSLSERGRFRRFGGGSAKRISWTVCVRSTGGRRRIRVSSRFCGSGIPCVGHRLVGRRVVPRFLVLAVSNESEDARQHNDQHETQNAAQGRVVWGGGDVPIGCRAVAFRIAARSFAVRERGFILCSAERAVTGLGVRFCHSA